MVTVDDSPTRTLATTQLTKTHNTATVDPSVLATSHGQLWKLFALRIEPEARFDLTENNSYQSTMDTLNEAISVRVHATWIVYPHEDHQCRVINRDLHIEKPGVKSPQTTWPHLYQMVDVAFHL